MPLANITLNEADLALIELGMDALAAHRPELLSDCIRLAGQLQLYQARARYQNVQAYYTQLQSKLFDVERQEG